MRCKEKYAAELMTWPVAEDTYWLLHITFSMGCHLPTSSQCSMKHISMEEGHDQAPIPARW